jgi:transposase
VALPLAPERWGAASSAQKHQGVANASALASRQADQTPTKTMNTLGIDIRQVRMDALRGRLSVEQLLDIMDKQQHTVQHLHREMQRLSERLAQYEPEVRREAAGCQSSPQGPSTSYSLDAEEKRRRRRKRRRKKKSPGRRPTALKFADAQRTEDIYPKGIRRSDCHLVRERAVWRLVDGRAVLVGYCIFAGPGGKEPPIPGVTPRCEYGIEILVVLAFLVHIIGISLDKACAVLGFFCQLPLSRSQADALLRQLAQHWEKEFDLLCALLAYAAVVYLDETGWQVGKEGCSLWAFASQCQRVFLFGCHKDDATLDTILPPEVFDGIGVSDDAAVYRDRFTRAQKCGAHLLRKAIRLALLYPRKKTYQRFLDQLLALYHQAKRAAADGRLGEAGRQQRVAELEGRLCELCQPYWRDTTADPKPYERDFTNLVNELLRLMEAEELFTFVLLPEVQSTNNFMERQLRNPAQDRKTGRTSKTAAGAHRRSIIVSVLESLRANLETFNLTTVLEEVGRWMKEGISLFAQQWQAVMANQPAAVPNTS